MFSVTATCTQQYPQRRMRQHLRQSRGVGVLDASVNHTDGKVRTCLSLPSYSCGRRWCLVWRTRIGSRGAAQNAAQTSRGATSSRRHPESSNLLRRSSGRRHAKDQVAIHGSKEPPRVQIMACTSVTRVRHRSFVLVLSLSLYMQQNASICVAPTRFGAQFVTSLGPIINDTVPSRPIVRGESSNAYSSPHVTCYFLST